MVELQIDNNKRMAKNALMLLFRMTLTMGVSLYTSRVVLQTLGIEDYGIYHVVAGFVTIIGFLYGAMSSATQRFLSFELGKPGNKILNDIFSISLNIHVIISVFIFILGETIGVWFLTNYMSIPVDRFNIAKWVFHLSLLSFIFTVISVPYNALVIAHEKMKVFAWISILDVFLKLTLIWLLQLFGIDKLFLYSILILMTSIIVFLTYKFYCNFSFDESRYRLIWDKFLFNKLISYIGWSIWGTISIALNGQGINVLLNLFFGPSINAARAIAMQVAGALNHFGWSIQVAIDPQIIKSYAKADMSYMYRIVCYGAKYNVFILLVLSTPILINTEEVLNIWLGSVPLYASIFLKLTLINVIVDSMSATLITSARATGNIKVFETVVSSILLLNLPLSYFIIKMGVTPDVVLYAGIVISIVALIIRLIILKQLILIPIFIFLKEVVYRPILVVSSTSVLGYTLIHLALNKSGFWLQTIIITFCLFISLIVFGFDNIERNYVFKKIKVNRIFFN